VTFDQPQNGCLNRLKAILPDVSRETFERLEGFEQHFRQWNAKINLAAPSAAQDLWDRHILDSAQLASLRPLTGTWVDIGSGGGFPGVILAILIRERVETKLFLVESVGKKSAFLRSALRNADTTATVLNQRIEDATPSIPVADVVTARALAPLSSLLGLAEPWLGKGATGLFHKGREFRQEVAVARDVWAFDLLEHPSKVDANSVILEISNVSPRLPA
jgi:16S rRNA (guanine527-N7)-methyltransferase